MRVPWLAGGALEGFHVLSFSGSGLRVQGLGCLEVPGSYNPLTCRIMKNQMQSEMEICLHT